MDNLNDDIRELRSRTGDLESVFGRLRDESYVPPMRYVGQVYKGPSYNPAAPAFYLTHPVTSIVGPQTEGSTPTVNADATRTVVVAVFDRAPNAGDVLVAMQTQNGFWVAERSIGSGTVTTGGIFGSIPFCFCDKIPATLTMVSCDPNCNFGMFQNCIIQYMPIPSVFASLNLGPYGFVSTASFTDVLFPTYPFYYYLTCHFGQFYLSRLYVTSLFGSPYRDGVLYTWNFGSGSNSSGNNCSGQDLQPLCGGLPGHGANPWYGYTGFYLCKGVGFPGSGFTCGVGIFSGPQPPINLDLGSTTNNGQFACNPQC